jgi:vancomycin permeability regulator SanA
MQEAISCIFHGNIPLMFIKILKVITRICFILTAASLLLLLTLRLVTVIFAQTRKTSVLDAKPAPAAVVFGAGLWRDGSPTPVLRDRVRTAVDLYFAGKVSKILMSGDNRFLYYNEPGAMREYALSLGVPEDDIVLDYAGRRTYDTCYRAKQIFGLEEVILVTQGFHLPRALYTCNMLNLKANGVAADLRQYNQRSLTYWQIRETFATLMAFWEVHFSRPLPVLGTPEPIFVEKISKDY